MARPSKLSDKQREEIERRLLAGEKPAAIAKEYGVHRSAITRNFAQQVRNVKTVAKQIIETEEALKSLPVAQQIQAVSLADDLRAISTHLASAAKYGSMTSAGLSLLANKEFQKVKEAQEDKNANIVDSLESLKGVSALTRLANDSSEIGLNLMRANKEVVDELNRNNDKPEPKQIIFTVTDASA